MNSLIQTAKDIIEKHYSPNHKVAAALRMKDGTVFTSVSVQGQKVDLCSEWSAITQALMSGGEIEMAVAVHRDSEGNFEIYPPCGLCRELYLTYCPEAQVILGDNETITARDLLPRAWTRK